MKKNEAPEKIYIQKRNSYNNILGYDSEWTPIPLINEYNIEYTRTDAFIEKAISWLEEQDEIIGISFQEDFLERFKNYMKAE